MFERKRKLTSPLAALVLIAFLAACNLPSPAPDEDEADVISLVGSAEAPTLDPDADHDPCLDGNWVMPRADLDLLIASLAPVPNMRVVGGSLSMSFADGLYTYSGELTLQIELDMSRNQYMQADAVFSSGGPYATENRSVRDSPIFTFLVLDLTATESNVLVWRAYKNGVVQTEPGSGPSFIILPPADAPYRCGATRLEISTQGVAGPVTMFFQR